MPNCYTVELTTVQNLTQIKKHLYYQTLHFTYVDPELQEILLDCSTYKMKKKKNYNYIVYKI